MSTTIVEDYINNFKLTENRKTFVQLKISKGCNNKVECSKISTVTDYANNVGY